MYYFFYRLCIYCLPLEIQLSIEGGWDPIKPHHIFVSVPSQDLNFQRHKSWSFLYSVEECER